MPNTEPEKKKKVMPDVRALLGGQSVHARARQKERKVCDWIYRHGYSTAEIIRQVSGQAAPGYAKKLKDCGLLVETRTTGAEVPKFFYTLSKAGLELAERYTPKLIRYKCLEPYKLSQAQFRHNFAVQKLTIDALDAGIITDYRTPAQSEQLDGKRPDSVWRDTEGKSIAVEVEFSQKFGRERDMSIDAVITTLHERIYDAYFFFSDAAVILRNYRAAMQPGQTVNVWTRNEKNVWVIDKDSTYTIPDWLPADLFFEMTPQIPFKDPRAAKVIDRDCGL